jgi:hypothetical protein
LACGCFHVGKLNFKIFDIPLALLKIEVSKESDSFFVIRTQELNYPTIGYHHDEAA